MNFMKSLLARNKEEPYLGTLFQSLKEIRDSDIFIVGFPKSGNTWIRFLIGNYINANKCDFKNIHRTVPGLVEHTSICNELRDPRFMSSHFSLGAFREFISHFKANKKAKPKVIFLVRDGRDVAVSYYYHLIKAGKLSDSTSFLDFIEFLNGGRFNPFQSWDQYVLEWIKNGAKDFDVLIIKYKDVLEDTYRSLEDILKFSGLSIDKEKILYSVNQSSFDEMQRLEKNQGIEFFSSHTTESDILFVRKGKYHGWDEKFDSKSYQKFMKVNSKALKELGYDLG